MGGLCGPANCLRTSNVCLRLPVRARPARFAGSSRWAAAKYSLSWSDGAASLVEVVRQQPRRSMARLPSTSPPRGARSPIADAGRDRRSRTPRRDRRSRTPGAIADRGFMAGAAAGTVPAIKNQMPQQVFMRRSDAGAVTRGRGSPTGTIPILRQVRHRIAHRRRRSRARTRPSCGKDVIPHIRAMTMDREGGTLYAGTDDGRLVRWQVRRPGRSRRIGKWSARFADGRAVTAPGSGLRRRVAGGRRCQGRSDDLVARQRRRHAQAAD